LALSDVLQARYFVRCRFVGEHEIVDSNVFKARVTRMGLHEEAVILNEVKGSRCLRGAV
jgi:hypothetical protein